MKKTGILLVMCLAAVAAAQQTSSMLTSTSEAPAGTEPTAISFPFERIQAPTSSDLNCAGFVNPELLPNSNFVAGGLETPTTTRYANGEIIYLAGSGYQIGQKYMILRELRNPNDHEIFAGQKGMVKAMGHPYEELARAKIIDTRSRMGIAQIEVACNTVVPGDIAVPFVEKPAVAFHPPVRFDRFMPATPKTSGRIVLARDFESLLATGSKVYMNVGANQGVKVGDYFRAVRMYSADLKDEADSLSFKASTTEDTQRRPPAIEPTFLDHSKGPRIHVADLPRRAVGEIVVISTTPTTSTGMLVFALEDVHVGDNVELDEQQQ